MGARYGQHFLRSARAIATILDRFDARRDDRVVEIGPGRGALTRSLIEQTGAFAAIEVDRVLAKDLAAAVDLSLLEDATGRFPLAAKEHITRAATDTAGASSEDALGRRRWLLCADALEVSYADLAVLLGGSETMPLRVVGNLPYAVATALIRRMVRERHLIQDAVVMVQKEVADRLLAGPGSKEYGILSVVLALTADRERVLNLGPGAFTPPPKIHSTVVAIRFRRPPLRTAEEDASLEAMLKIAFSERRKKMASNLARGYALTREAAHDLMSACGAPGEARAEQVAPDVFARIAAALPSAVPRQTRAPRGSR